MSWTSCAVLLASAATSGEAKAVRGAGPGTPRARLLGPHFSYNWLPLRSSAQSKCIQNTCCCGRRHWIRSGGARPRASTNPPINRRLHGEFSEGACQTWSIRARVNFCGRVISTRVLVYLPVSSCAVPQLLSDHCFPCRPTTW